jgi:NAD(P)-dependent dehydrogenase (short-subunit alcohol dehydrogenase family)
MELKDKHIVVTGGKGALGHALVALLEERGATVRIADLPEIDLLDEAAVTAFYAERPPLWASIQVAGGFAISPLTGTTLAAYRAMLDINVTTCFLACREAVRAIRKGGGGGRIVNIAARAALEAPGGMATYVTAKAAVVALTRAIAAETLHDGILVNAVAPSIIDTPRNRADIPNADFAKWPKPQEVAEAIAWLASPRNTLTSGTVMPVYGRA